ncbi:MAG: inositol-3-phosphate synthase [Omnitrophica bacterium RIFCSPHIGHO2_02_FULL_49_9]|nr:MAG: inositol-3-phosphate synthase [Omnitrophica bacterium RIFCSPHIGHO2_02_FULL_49_9]OGW89699.1 MAG: inositol-3-phosphate synthase [Omnitrophica bacterium RIFCSPLOWO2_01_FULL_50_24]
MDKIKIAVVGVGNCADSLIQGLEHYRQNGKSGTNGTLGIINENLGGYLPQDIEVVCAFDIDKRKVGERIDIAVRAKPNCTMDLNGRLPKSKTIVQMGPILDGISEHMKDYPSDRTFLPSNKKPVNVEKALKESEAEILLNYLPVGSEEATKFYAEACLKTGVSLINCIPVFIVSDPEWAKRFEAKRIPCIGDDVKSQIGATIVHRTLAKLFIDRGVKIDRTYQLNTGGNTDFLNMLNRERLKSKKISKTAAVQSQLDEPLAPDQIHIGPSDYVPWQNDNKVCYLRIEGRGFGGFPVSLEARLSVEDSPNSAGVTIDAIRCAKIARDRKIGGPLTSISAFCMKHPPKQINDTEAKELVRKFVQGTCLR